MTKENMLSHSPYLPVDLSVPMYNASFGHAQPWEFSGWKKETLSWKEGVYLHAGLNPPMPYRLSGPGAFQLLKDNCINGFQKFSIGCSKHAVMCNEFGNVMADGMVLRVGEEEFETFYLSPYIEYLVKTTGYDVRGEDTTGKNFLFQIAGPRSLEVMEAATGESLRDIEFLWHRSSRIKRSEGDIEIRVYRLGVARTLAYEIHGDIEDALHVYEAIVAVGRPFGIERLGLQAYGMNHTEGGFAQSFIHFLPAYTQDPEFMSYLGGQYDRLISPLRGSAGNDISKRYANPVELGWAHMVKFDHEFSGQEAIRTIIEAPARKAVTLEWNEADIVGVYASQFGEQDSQFMDFPANAVWQGFVSTVFSDDVFVDGKLVGISSGRMFSQYYKKMISLCLIDVSVSEIGQSVEVLWGEPDTNQVTIRARVARYPYLDIPFNRDIDVSVEERQ